MRNTRGMKRPGPLWAVALLTLFVGGLFVGRAGAGSYKTPTGSIWPGVACSFSGSAVPSYHTVTWAATSSCKTPGQGLVLCASLSDDHGGFWQRCVGTKPTTSTGASSIVCTPGHEYRMIATMLRSGFGTYSETVGGIPCQETGGGGSSGSW